MKPGTQLGPYEIKKQLGAGGMGEVWLAKDVRLGREVAIKVLPPQFAADPERLARFDQEARAAAALNHPHIAVVHDIGHEDGTYFMVQERLEGQTLRALLESGRPALGKSLDLCIEIAEALTAAHGAGIVHRDLKPDNVFVSKDGHAKVLDFGLAKLMELSAVASPGGASMSPTMVGTVAGQVMGTAGYMAPEQIEGGEIDHRADVFAFGIVLYEMATGRQPFAGRNVVDTLSLITNEPAPDLAEVDESLPRELQRILHKALAKDPAGRYQSAADLVVDLRGLAADVEADRAVSLASGTGPVAVSGYPASVVAGAVAAALLVGAAAVWVFAGAAETVQAPSWTFEIPFGAGQTHPPCCGRQIDIARDGSLVAYVANTEAGRQLFVRHRDQNEEVAVAGAGAPAVSISPDGEWLVYRGGSRETAGLFKVALAGGEPFRLTTGGYWPWWANDGWIYYLGSDDRLLMRVPELGGDAEDVPLEGLADGDGGGFITANPAGTHLILHVEDNSNNRRILALNLEAGTVRELVAEGSDPRWVGRDHLLYNRGGALYALPMDPQSVEPLGPAVPVLQGLRIDAAGAAQFAVAEDGTLAWHPGVAVTGNNAGWPTRLLAVDMEGDARPLTDRVEPYGLPRVSPDGQRVAIHISAEAGRDVWILELAQGVLSRLTVGGGRDPVWSPDGDWIYFARDLDDGRAIFRIAADFSGQPELILEGGQLRPSSVAPDGESLLFTKYEGFAVQDIGIVALGGEAEPRMLVAQPEFREYGARFSPDGRYFAYVSNEAGPNQIYLRETDGERRWLVSLGLAFFPVWAPDGSRLYYSARNKGTMAVAISYDPEIAIAPPELVLPSGSARGPYGLMSDGSFLMTEDATVESADDGTPAAGINIVLNWLDQLRRLVPVDR